MNYILAHDLGTSGNKATLYDDEGSLVASHRADYGVSAPRPGFAEQDPEDWWKAVLVSTGRLLANTGVDPASIACVTFSGQMMGCLPVDREGLPLRPSIIWADMRSEAQAARLALALPVRDFYRIVGHRPVSSYSLTKLMWIKDNEPEIFARTAKILQAKDFIVARLTGEFATDFSDASGTNAFDLVGKRWSREILSEAGINPGLFPEAFPSSTVVGKVGATAARLSGLREGTPVVIGGGDGSCAAVGAGVVGAGKAYNVLGSSSWVSFASDAPVLDARMRTFNWVHLDERKYLPCGTMQAAGLSVEWVRKALLGQTLPGEGAEGGIDLLNAEALRSARGSGGLLYLPYLMGERSPRWDADARAAFIGMTARTTRGDLFRSVFEGVAFNLRTIISSLEGARGIGEIVLIGGGAKSLVWRRVLAGVWNRPLLIPRYLDEATSLGAAVAGGVGVGIFTDYSVAETINPVVERVEPDEGDVVAYERLYPIFETCYESLRPAFKALAKLEGEDGAGSLRGGKGIVL